MARGLILQPPRRPDSGRKAYDLYRGAVAAFREWLEGCSLESLLGPRARSVRRMVWRRAGNFTL